MKLLSDYVLVSPVEEEMTTGGIIIPDTAKEKPTKGIVISVGDGKKDEPMVLKKGDNIIFQKYSGTELEMDDEKYILIRQSDVYCITGP